MLLDTWLLPLCFANDVLCNQTVSVYSFTYPQKATLEKRLELNAAELAGT